MENFPLITKQLTPKTEEELAVEKLRSLGKNYTDHLRQISGDQDINTPVITRTPEEIQENLDKNLQQEVQHFNTNYPQSNNRNPAAVSTPEDIQDKQQNYDDLLENEKNNRFKRINELLNQK